MRPVTKVLCVLCAFVLLMPVTIVGAAVDWANEVTDPKGDVVDSDGNPVTGHEDVDIISVRTAEEGDDLNVTLVLAGAYNSSATYTVRLLADGADLYNFTMAESVGYRAYDPSGATLRVDGHLSGDGTEISWVVAKSDVGASSSLGISNATTEVLVPGTSLTLWDEAEGGPPADPVLTASSIIIVVEFLDLTHRVTTVVTLFEDEEASEVRTMLDVDADGTLNASEVDDYIQDQNDQGRHTVTRVNFTLDGEEALSVEYEFDLEDAEGLVTSTDPLECYMTQVITFPEPEDQESHTYGFAPTEDFIGGDEPWENEMIGGDEPWENEMIGGDEPWENEADLGFLAIAPDGWVYNTNNWTLDLEQHLPPEGNVIEMDDTAVRADYNDTIGELDSLVLDMVEEEPIIPHNITVAVDFEDLTHREAAVFVTYEGENASRVRMELDTDTDGTVSASEAEAYEGSVNAKLQSGVYLVNGTLDGKKPVDFNMEFLLRGVEGRVEGTDQIIFTMVQYVTFPEPEDSDSHTYGFEEAVGGDEPWDNEFIGDDPWEDEFIGDDPWENVFVGGDDPWDDELIGGDDPWENEMDVLFSVHAPDGWRFSTEDWPSGLEDFLTSDGTVIKMDAAATRASYRTTMGRLTYLVVEKEPYIIPRSVTVVVDFEQLNIKKTTITVVYEGENASRARGKLDMDADGTVSAVEVEAYQTLVNINLRPGSTMTDSTLDGSRPTSVDMEFSMEGAEGSVEDTGPMTLVMVQTVTFRVPAEGSSHTYGFDEAVGGDEPWDNKFIGDDPWNDEFVGGDEPWDDEFVGGDEPWDNEFVGGDEPWDNKMDVVFTVQAPVGWRFATTDWPPGLGDFLSSDGSTIDMDASETWASYSATMGKLTSLAIEKVQTGGGGGDDDSPGFGLALVLIGLLVVAMLAYGKRSRT